MIQELKQVELAVPQQEKTSGAVSFLLRSLNSRDGKLLREGLSLVEGSLKNLSRREASLAGAKLKELISVRGQELGILKNRIVSLVQDIENHVEQLKISAQESASQEKVKVIEMHAWSEKKNQEKLATVREKIQQTGLRQVVPDSDWVEKLKQQPLPQKTNVSKRSWSNLFGLRG